MKSLTEKTFKKITELFLTLVSSCAFATSSFAADIVFDSPVSITQYFTSHNQTMTVSAEGNLSSIKNNSFTGSKIIVEASSSNGINLTSKTTPAINISNGANLASLDLKSGNITSNFIAISFYEASGTTNINTASGTIISGTNSAINARINKSLSTHYTPDLTIQNAGSITSTGSAISYSGISSSKLSVINSGLIQGSSNAIGVANATSSATALSNTIVNESGGEINGNILISGTSSSTIINKSGGEINGNISISGPTSSESPASDVSITNSGIINGHINSSASLKYINLDIKNFEDFEKVKIILRYINLDITNNAGSITGNIFLSKHADSSFNLNGGSITGNLSSGNASQLLNLNGGSFNGDIFLFSGSTLNIATTKLNGSVDSNSPNSSSINLTDNNTFGSTSSLGTANGLSSINISDNKTININGSIRTQTLKIGSNATLNLGSDNIYANTTSLNGTLNFSNTNRTINGNIVGSGAGTINLNSASHNIIGNLTLKSGDSININLTNAKTFGKVTVTGITSIDANTNLNVAISPNYSFIASGSKYNIVDGQDGSSINAINDSKININNSNSNKFSLLTFTTNSVNNDLILIASRKPAEAITYDTSSQSAYNVINEIGASATGELKSLQEYLDNSSSISQVKEVLNSVTTQDTNSIKFSHVNVVNNSVKTAENRMDEIHFASLDKNSVNKSSSANITEASYEGNNSNSSKKSGISLGDSLENNGIWAQTFGTAAKQNNINENDGYDSKSLGFAFGYDKEVTKNTSLGLGLSYANSHIKSSDSLKTTNIDTYQINAYSGHSFGKYFLDTVLGFAWNDYTSNRLISSVNRLANSNYQGQTYITKVRSGFVKDIGNGFNITPEASLNFVRNNTDSYTENGAGSVNLDVKSSSSNFLEGRLGLNLGYEMTTKKHTKISPKISASYGYNFLNNRQTTTSNFVGQTATFNNLSSKNDPKSLKIGGGIDIYGANSFVVSGEYIMEKRNKYQSHSGVLRVRFEY